MLAVGTCAILAYALYIGAAMGPPSVLKGDGNSTVLTYMLDVIIEQLYGIAEALIKISILLFYRRVFAIDSFRRVANVSIALVSIWALLFLLLFIFPVTPISTSWQPNTPSHQNYDWTKVLLWHAITNIGLDVYVLCLPLPIIRGLHMSRGRKFAVVGIMWLGSFCVIASCIRLGYVVGVGQEQVYKAGSGTDAVSEAALWCVIEPCCSVIAGCLPTLGPLIKGTKAAEWVSTKIRRVTPKSSSPNATFVGESFLSQGSKKSSIGSGLHVPHWARKKSSIGSNMHAPHWVHKPKSEQDGEASVVSGRTDSTVVVGHEHDVRDMV